MKRKYIKGFTLVELIFVLAILAIHAAMLIPSLTGYIDKAKEKEDVSNARTVLVSSQSVLSELWVNIRLTNTRFIFPRCDQSVKIDARQLKLILKSVELVKKRSRI